MKLYRGQITAIARDIISTLEGRDAVEILDENRREALLDVESVLKEYVRVDRDLTEKARDVAAGRGVGGGAIFKIKRELARRQKFAVGDDAIDWIVAQIIEMLLYSQHIEEVYEENRYLSHTIHKIIRTHSETESDLDREVRGRLKNLEEGTAAWDIEYKRAMERLQRNKGMA